MKDEEILILKYAKLQELYREKNFKNIEDKVINNIHINDHNIFPLCWNNIRDFNIRNALLEEALKRDVLLEELDYIKKYDEERFTLK